MKVVPVLRRAKATLADAAALLNVERQSLCDSPYDPARIANILRRPEHGTYLAFVSDRPVGFCSCIATNCSDGSRREIDMLGVVPDYQGRGIGTSLIRACVDELRLCDSRQSRAVVAVDNVASQRAFAKAGFVASGRPVSMTVYEILGQVPISFLPPLWRWRILKEGTAAAGPATAIWDARGLGREVHILENAQGAAAAAAECQQVQTMAYRGLWVEKLWAASQKLVGTMGRALVERAKALGLDEVGYLLPEECQERMLVPLIREGYIVAGEYMRFTEGTP